MGKDIDYGQDPMPGSGVFVVKAIVGSRADKELGRVTATSMDEAVRKATREIPATATTDFVVTELPLGEA